jgi:hypothetical protein
MWHANASVANWSPPPGATKHPLLLSTHFFWSPRTKSHIYFSQKVRSVIYLCHRFSVQIISGCLCSGLVSIYLSGASLQGVKDGRLRDVPPRLPAFCDRGQLDRSGGCVLGHGSFPQYVGDGKHCLKMEFRGPGKRRKVGRSTRFALGMEHGGGRPGRQKQGAHHTQGRSVGEEPSLTAIYSLLLLFAPLRPPHQPSSLHLPPLLSRSLSSIRVAFPWAVLCCHGLGRVSFRMSTCVIAAAATAAAPANATLPTPHKTTSRTKHINVAVPRTCFPPPLVSSTRDYGARLYLRTRPIPTSTSDACGHPNTNPFLTLTIKFIETHHTHD